MPLLFAKPEGSFCHVEANLFYTGCLNKNSKGKLFVLKNYLYSVSNFWPIDLCQETNIWINVVSPGGVL